MHRSCTPGGSFCCTVCVHTCAHMLVDVHVCVCMCTGVPTNMCVHASGGQRSVQALFLHCSPLYFLRWGLSLSPSLAVWLGGPQESSCLHLPSTRIRGAWSTLSVVTGFWFIAVNCDAFNMGSRRLNLGPYTYMASTYQLSHLSSP